MNTEEEIKDSGAIGDAQADPQPGGSPRPRVAIGFVSPLVRPQQEISFALNTYQCVRPKQLITSRGFKAGLFLSGLRVGQRSYLYSSEPIPLRIFEGSLACARDPIDWHFDPILIGQPLIMTVRSMSDGEERRVAGIWICELFPLPAREA